MCWEELDSMLPKELNKLKGTMTMPSINDRAPYERYHKNRPHLASFCGTGNNVRYLSSSVAMQIVGAQNMKDVSAVKLGRAFTAMGFDYKIIDGIRRYYVIRRQADEIKLHREQPDLGAGGSGEVW